MSELLKIVLSLSLSGTLLFFIVLALKPLYKNKLSKRWQYYVWLIVIVRMLIPFTPETTLVGSAFQHLGNINVGTIQSAPPTNDVQSDFEVGDNYTTPNTEPQTPKSTIDTAPSLSIQTIITKLYENLWMLWAAIAFALLIRKITMYQSFVRFVKAGRTEVADIEILNLLADSGETIGVKRPVELFINPLISSPMLLGFFCPYIILPSIELDKTELAYIMRHELTHYKHLDMFYKWLVQLTVCLHWFNPFAYLLAKEINKCCELSCDEAIIRTMDKDEKKAYGDTLLNSLKAMGNYNDKLATVTLAESAEQLKERLDAIMKFKKASKITVTIMLVLTLVLTVGAAAIGAYAATPVNNNNNGYTTMIPQAPSNNHSTNSAEQLTVSSSGILPDNAKELAIDFDIDNGGIEILPATSNEIKASYDSEYYNVAIANKNGKWVIKVTGKVAMMGKTDDVRVYIPDIKCTMDVDVLDGNFSYALPDNCADIVNITAENAGVDFTSKNQYKNSAISLIATNKDFIKYEPPVYPSYFTKTNTGFEYTNGTGENKINIKLSGYTSVNFLDASASNLSYTPVSALENIAADNAKSISITAKSCGIELVKSESNQFTFDYLGVENPSAFKVNASSKGNSLEIIVDGTSARATGEHYYIDDGANPVNVVRIGIPDREYQNLTMTLNEAPVSLLDFKAKVNIQAEDGTVSISDKDISKGSYNINNTSGGVSITATTVSSNISIENQGECELIFNQVPQNLGLDLSACRGQIVLPDGWSKTQTFGNGVPSIKINNQGYTELKVMD